jgi:adenylate cyclase class 2
MNKEIEIKIKIDKETFNRFIKDKSDFQFERTYGYFTENYENMAKGIFPRIKDMEDVALVSVKVKTNTNSSMFERDEYEFEIEASKVGAARLMFKALGYCVEHIFEKKRYKLGLINNCDFIVDELPFGYFVELEGEQKDIEKSIESLGLEKNEKINGAYLKLWEKYKKENNLTGKCIFDK